MTILVNIISYALLVRVLQLDALVANAISWVCAVSFAYVTNKNWVFKGNATHGEAVMKELGKFVVGRIATLLVEEVILFVFVKWLCFDSLMAKIVAQAIVILLKELPRNAAAHLAASFPPVISCRFFDLPPVNLQNLQESLTKNSLAS